MLKTDVVSYEIEKGDELLPIGSIVLVEFIPQAIMIYGRKQEQASTNKVWDYVACPYPQGYLSDKTNVFFNHTHIKEVIFKGLESKGEQLMKEKLDELFKAGDK